MSLPPGPHHDASPAAPTVAPTSVPARSPEQSELSQAYRRLNRVFTEIESNEENITAELGEALPILPFNELMDWIEIISHLRPCFTILEGLLEKEIQRRLMRAIYGDLPARDLKRPTRGVEVQTLLDSRGDRNQWLVIIPAQDLPEGVNLRNLLVEPPGGGRSANRDGRIVFNEKGEVLVPLNEIRPFVEWVEEQSYRAETVEGLETIGEAMSVTPEERIMKIKEEFQFIAVSGEIQRLAKEAGQHHQTAQGCLQKIGIPRTPEAEKRRAVAELPGPVSGLCDIADLVSQKMRRLQKGWDEIHQHLKEDTRHLVKDETEAFLQADRAAKTCERLRGEILRTIERITRSADSVALIQGEVDSGQGDDGFKKIWDQVCREGQINPASASKPAASSGGGGSWVDTLKAIGSTSITLGRHEPAPVVAPQLIALAQGKMPEGGYAMQERGPDGKVVVKAGPPAREIPEEQVVVRPVPAAPIAPPRELLLKIPEDPTQGERLRLTRRASLHKASLVGHLDNIATQKGTMSADMAKRTPFIIAQMISKLVPGQARINLIEDWGIEMFDRLFAASQVLIKIGTLFYVNESLVIQPEGEEEDLAWFIERAQTILGEDKIKNGLIIIPLKEITEVVGRLSQQKKEVSTRGGRIDRLRELIE